MGVTSQRVLESLEAQAPHGTVFRVRMSGRGTIQSLLIHQLDGDLDGFAVDFFNSEKAYPEGHQEEPEEVPETELGDRIYRFMETITVAAGERTYDERGKNWGYRNIDRGSSNLDRALYLRIVPGGAGLKHFYVQIGNEPTTAG